jgi:Fic family protein
MKKQVNIGKEMYLLLAALAHHKLVNIHPFTDGNGRTARLFLNLILMQQGCPLVVILKNDRKKYYRALEMADRGKTDHIEKFIAQAVERSMNIYLKAIQPGTGPKEKLIKLSELAKGTPYSEKYLNLLARSGKLESHKEGRLWFSSNKSLEEYLQKRERKR